jgi:hypothetical protein
VATLRQRQAAVGEHVLQLSKNDVGARKSIARMCQNRSGVRPAGTQVAGCEEFDTHRQAKIRMMSSRASLLHQSMAASTSAQNFAILKPLPASKPRRTITALCDGMIIAYWPWPPLGE